MQRTLISVLTVIGLASTAAIPAMAQDFLCRQATGCVAQIPENGQLKTVVFRRGDIVSTEEGWIVDPKDGWMKIKSKEIGNTAR